MHSSSVQTENFVDLLNGLVTGMDETIGLRFVSATVDEIVATVTVGPHLHQPYGLVHGGVYASMIESLASSGAALTGMQRDQSVVGLENTTSFLRAVRTKELRGVARPLVRGRKFHVWEVNVFRDDGKLVATGRVRMACLEQGTLVAGQEPQVKGG